LKSARFRGHYSERAEMAIKTQGTRFWFKKDANTLVEIVITSLGGLSGARDQIDITTLVSQEREYLAGFASPDPVQIGINYDPAYTAQRDLRALYDSGATARWIVGLSDGVAPPTIAADVITLPTTRTFLSFDAYVSNFPREFGINDAVRSNVTLQRSGKVTTNEKA
jgi:hypothetical protein